MRKPPKAAFDHPTARQHNKAFLSGFAADHVVAHAMEVGPFAAAIGGKATIEDSQPQARPVRAAAIKRRERVALLHRSRNGVDRQPDAIRINQGHTLAPNHHLGRVIAPRTAMHVTVCVSMIPRLALNDVPPRAAAAPQPRTSGGRTGQARASGGTSHTPSATAAGATARPARGRRHADARQSPAQPPASVWPPHCEVDQPVPANGPPSSRPTAIPYPSGEAHAAPGAPSSTSSLTAPSGGPHLQLPRMKWGLRSTSALKQALSSTFRPSFLSRSYQRPEDGLGGDEAEGLV